MPRLSAKHRNPRWHLVNYIPVWISQAGTSVVVASLPFLCFSSCGGPNSLAQNMAIAICIISIIAVVIEGVLFAFGYLRPLASLVMQVVKILIIWTQWTIVALNDSRGQAKTGEQWRMALVFTGLFTVLSLTFSIHLLYAVVDFLLSQLWPRRVEGFGEAETQAEKLMLIPGYGDDRKEGSLKDDLTWPLRGKLWPNWILQLIFVPVLCWSRLIGLSLSRSDQLSRVFTYFIATALVCPIVYEIWYSLRKNGRRLSLRSYLQVQLLKIGILYFMLDLVVAAHGGWRPQVDAWLQSLFWVFKLSIAFGSPYIAEFAFVAAVHMKYQQKLIETSEEVSHEDDDIEADTQENL